MTKKSMARLARDARKQREEDVAKLVKDSDNKCWDDLNNIHNDCRALLLKHVHLGREINDKDLIAAVEDKKTLVTNIKQLSSDLAQLTSELNEIATQHAGKTGGADDPDTVVSTFRIFEQYTLFKERHDAVVMPTVYHILEQVQKAEDKLNAAMRAAQAAAAATDPAVVTDVAYKEVTAETAPEGATAGVAEAATA